MDHDPSRHNVTGMLGRTICFRLVIFFNPHRVQPAIFIYIYTVGDKQSNMMAGDRFDQPKNPNHGCMNL